MQLIRSIYLAPNWGKLQERKEDGPAKIFYYRSDSGTVMYPFIMREAGEIDGTTYYDIVTARGEGGPVITEEKSADIYKEFNTAFNDYCTQNNIIAEYVKFDPWNTDAAKFSEFYDISRHGYCFCHKLQEDFFKTQYSTKRRNQIRKAINSGIRIETDADWKYLDNFLKLYEYTVSKHSVSNYYLLDNDFLANYKPILQDRAKLGLAFYQDKLIAAGIFLNGGDVYHYHFSASDPEYTDLNAISLLVYREAQLGADEGCTIMDLGSAIEGSGLEKYKKSMVREDGIIPAFVGKKIRNKNIYNALIEKNGRSKDGFFPEYIAKRKSRD